MSGPLVCAFAVSCLLGVVGCGNVSHHSTAYDLYVIDLPPEGALPSGENDPQLDPYRRALQRIKAGCKNSERSLGDFTVAVVQKLNKDTALGYTNLQVLKTVASGVGTQPVDCKRTFAFIGASLEKLSG